MRKNKLPIFFIYVLIFAATFAIYFITSPKTTPYDYFTRLSNAFIHQRVYLTQNPPWLNELIPINGKYYVAYPPMPAIVMIPLVAFLGTTFSQTIFSILLGSINPLILYALLKRIKTSTKTSLLTTIFFTFGTNYWYLTTIGSAWYLAHVVAIFFLFLALWETFGKQRLLLIGLFLGASFWSRTTVIFTLPFFLFYMRGKFWPLNKKSVVNLVSLAAGLGCFVLLDFVYNYLRFSSINPLSPYSEIPVSQRPQAIKNGFISFKNIPMQLSAIFLSLPKFQNSWPYILPSLYSTAIWFTSPAIILIFKAKKSILMVSSWLAIIPTFFVISLWMVVGYSQFGYRFAQDFMPFLLILVSLGIGQKPKKIAYFLVTLSILINLWGVIMITFLNKWTI